ncbi:MAG: hypothetical protein KJ714_02985 [Euryarchaeota archaeon]|nr:hypothetical protein [Euryarchaeota archaeon]
MPINSGMKLLVALLYAKGVSGKINEPIRGITRLEKLVFLLQKEGKFKEFYEFEAYDYGPWSGDIHDDIETLEEGKLAKIQTEKVKVFAEVSDEKECVEHETFDEESAYPTEVKLYSLSDNGLRAGEKVFEQLTLEERQKILEIKRKYNSIPLVDLLKYVYTKYPEAATESKIKEKILSETLYGKRPQLSHLEREE